MMNTAQIEQYWQRYLKTLQNELGQLVIDSVKTATCSALWEWEASGSTPRSLG
jgi:hypothetical protein